MSKLREQVEEFHRVFDQPIVDTPTVPPDERVRLRARLIAEEFFEVLEAMFAGRFSFPRGEVMKMIDQYTPMVKMVDLADGLADLDYVVEGARLEFGIDGGPIADEVHRNNIAKSFMCLSCLGGGCEIAEAEGHGYKMYDRVCKTCDGTGKVSKKRHDGKVLKHPDWTPPNIEGELKKQGYKGGSK